MLKTLSAASLTLLLAGTAAPAFAQSVYDWSGPYVGVFGSFVQPDDDANETLVFDRDLDGQFDDTVVTDTGANAFATGFCGDQFSSLDGPDATPCDRDGSGVEGGVKLGYDWQFGSWVVGAVGELAAVSAEDSVTGFSTTPAAYSFTRKMEHMAAVRARVGYAAGPGLVYVTGGPAYGKVHNSFFTTNQTNSFVALEDEDDADGFQFGGGVEWRLEQNLLFNAEYIYSDLEAGEHVVRAGPGTASADNPFLLGNPLGTDMTRSADSLKLHHFRIGMNVRF
jgi:outer membrane immunogenic protein